MEEKEEKKELLQVSLDQKDETKPIEVANAGGTYLGKGRAGTRELGDAQEGGGGRVGKVYDRDLREVLPPEVVEGRGPRVKWSELSNEKGKREEMTEGKPEREVDAIPQSSVGTNSINRKGGEAFVGRRQEKPGPWNAWN